MLISLRPSTIAHMSDHTGDVVVLEECRGVRPSGTSMEMSSIATRRGLPRITAPSTAVQPESVSSSSRICRCTFRASHGAPRPSSPDRSAAAGFTRFAFRDRDRSEPRRRRCCVDQVRVLFGDPPAYRSAVTALRIAGGNVRGEIAEPLRQIHVWSRCRDTDPA